MFNTGGEGWFRRASATSGAAGMFPWMFKVWNMLWITNIATIIAMFDRPWKVIEAVKANTAIKMFNKLFLTKRPMLD